MRVGKKSKRHVSARHDGTISRRTVLPAAVGVMVVPRHVLGGPGFTPPSDRLSIVAVGLSGIARAHLPGVQAAGGGCHVYGLCDVDWPYAEPTFRMFPEAKRYRDFREMFDKEKDKFDAVYVATPDHNHAIVAIAALKLRKHVLCVKPLARTVHECRTLARTAAETGVATQITASSRVDPAALRLYEMLWDGVIGDVREVHAWSDRPIWPQAVSRPQDTPPVPDGLDWKLWLGPARPRPYHPAYHPWIWRGWWDFGTGSLGDMGCHRLNSVLRALKLDGVHPLTVQAVSTTHYARPEFDYASGKLKTVKALRPETAPSSAILTWDFPAREGMPPVRLNWYDGGLKPPVPEELGDGARLPNEGVLYVGAKGKICSVVDSGHGELIPLERARKYGEPPRKLERLPWPRNIMQEEWVAACKGGKPASANFTIASHLTEIALLGNIATRIGKVLRWDPRQDKFANSNEANSLLHEEYHSGWIL